MKSSTATIFLLLWVLNLSARQENENRINPRFGIQLITMQGNMLKGLLMQVNDSSLILYPGKRKDWNKKVEYYPVSFSCSGIKEIKLKKKNSTVKGMLIGGGLSAVLAAILMNNETAKGGGASNAVYIVPAGMIGGAYLGSKSKKHFYINGSPVIFNEFQKKIQ
jgi:hypothetical protein